MSLYQNKKELQQDVHRTKSVCDAASREQSYVPATAGSTGHKLVVGGLAWAAAGVWCPAAERACNDCVFVSPIVFIEGGSSIFQLTNYLSIEKLLPFDAWGIW